MFLRYFIVKLYEHPRATFAPTLIWAGKFEIQESEFYLFSFSLFFRIDFHFIK